MDDKELDDILREIKQHAENEAKPEDALPASAKEEAPAEATPVEEAPIEEVPVEEAPAEETPVEETPAEEMFVITEEAPEEEAPAEEAPVAETPEEQATPDGEAEQETDLLSLLDEEGDDGDGDTPEEQPDDKKKKIIIAVVAALLVIALCVGVYFAFFRKPAVPEDTSTTKAVEVITEASTAAPELGPVNPLTGEADFNQAAIGKRPVAVVVENEAGVSAVRPQWGIADADMIMEGETEYATRMLFFWADYTDMADKIGSTRSARPPFIRFSQLFDSIFIHAGLSHSKGNYEGADDVFTNENIDHVNLLREGTEFFDRDKSRTTVIEHTGYFKGENAPKLIEKYKFRTQLDANRFTQFQFNESVQDIGPNKATSITFRWSDHIHKTGEYRYDESTGKYTTTDFDSRYGTADVSFENLILLLDTTEYIVKENYKGSGNSETYCNYNLDGGKGLVASNGTAVEITWKVENGKLKLTDANGKEVKLNVGKTYIAYGSSNHSGSFSFE